MFKKIIKGKTAVLNLLKFCLNNNNLTNLSSLPSDINNKIDILIKNTSNKKIEDYLDSFYDDVEFVEWNGLKVFFNSNDLVFKLFKENDLYFQSLKDDIKLLSIIINHYKENNLSFNMFDIGAQYGLVGLSIASNLKKEKMDNKVFLFDPGVAQGSLAYNIAVNSLKTVAQRENYAVSDETGSCDIYIKSGNSEDNHISKRENDNFDVAYQAKKVSIDDYINKKNILPNLILKIDTQGEEIKVIKGMEKVILNGTCCFLTEFTPWLYNYGNGAKDFLLTMSKDFYLFDMVIEYKNNLEILKKWKGIELTESIFDDYIADVNRYEYAYTDILAISKKIPNYSSLKNKIFLNKEKCNDNK